MSLNWVMLAPNEGGFVKLPKEQILYTSPTRTSLSLSSSNTFPGTQPWSVNSDSGVIYLTNQRIVYLPTNPTSELRSFSCPILNLKDSYVRAPFFGANYWCSMVRPVAGGNIPPQHPVIELKMTFREGGAFDYHTMFEQIKERLYNAVSLAQESGQNVGSMGNVDLQNVHLEQLPAYEPARELSDAEHAEERGIHSAEPPIARDSALAGLRNTLNPEGNISTPSIEPPNEPPPDYDEAQAQAVRFEFDQRLRDEAEAL